MHLYHPTPARFLERIRMDIKNVTCQKLKFFKKISEPEYCTTMSKTNLKKHKFVGAFVLDQNL
jgi:hypothetical protein